MNTSPRLPIELYAEILKALDSYQDRNTLLSAAPVNKEWRKHSQRILFSRMTDQWHGNEGEEYKNRLILRHMGFLRAIAEHPRRLGPLVHSYTQSGLSFNPAIMMNAERFPKSGSDLWDIIVRALPAMTNLKHLKLVPLIDLRPAYDNYVSSSALLRSFTFQLKTLTWAFTHHPENGFLEFIKTQKNIIHLDAEILRNADVLKSMDDGVCPYLVSATGNLASLSDVARSRRITAWKWTDDVLREAEPANQEDPSVLAQLKYLSLYSYGRFREIIGAIDLNITLLEIVGGTWGIGNPPSFLNMPMLRVIVLIQSTDSSASSEEISEIAIACFRQLPSLEYIIQRDPSGPGFRHRYLKLTLSPNPTAGILREEMRIEYGVVEPWWANYDI